MLNKELNGEMEVSTEELEEEQDDIECILQGIDIINRCTNDSVYLRRLCLYMNDTAEVHKEAKDDVHIYTYINLRITDNNIKHIKITVLHNKNDIINKPAIDGRTGWSYPKRDDIRCVLECFKIINKYTKKGTRIRYIINKIPAQAYYTKRRNRSDGRYTRIRIDNLYNGIESLEIKILTNKKYK